MSFDSDLDHSDYLNGPYPECADCGAPTDALFCEACSDARDAHTTALELRMAKATLRTAARAPFQAPSIFRELTEQDDAELADFCALIKEIAS